MISPFDISYQTITDYSNSALGSKGDESRAICHGVKNDLGNIISKLINRLHKKEDLHSYFEDVILVPVPRSTPLLRDSLWPGLRICQELQRKFPSCEISIAIERITAIRSSHKSKSSERPDVAEHVSSLGRTDQMLIGKVLLVDDVLTTGSTMLACASIINKEKSVKKVSAFAPIRTKTRDFVDTFLYGAGTIKLYPSGKHYRD